MGDLENAPSFADYRRSIEQYRALFAHAPSAVAVDCHPDYLSTKHGRDLAAQDALPVIAVQHHHAHLAACLAENLRAARHRTGAGHRARWARLGR